MFTQLCVSFSNTATMHFSLEVFLTTKPCDYIFVKLRTWLCVCEKTSMKTKVSIFLQFGCATGWRGITQQIITKHCVPRQLAVTSSRQQQLEQVCPLFPVLATVAKQLLPSPLLLLPIFPPLLVELMCEGHPSIPPLLTHSGCFTFC